MLDFFLLFLVLFGVLIGFLRGFVKEFFGFLGLLTSFVLAYLKYNFFLDFFGLESGTLVNFVSGLAVFIACIITAMLVNGWMMLLFKPCRLGMIDRSFGFIFGFFKGVFYSHIVVALIVIFCHSFFYKEDTKQEEKLQNDHYLPTWVKLSSSYKLFLIVDTCVNQLIPYRYSAKLEIFGKEFSEKLEMQEGSKDQNQ